MLFHQQNRCICSSRRRVVALRMIASLLLAHLSIASADTGQVKVGESLPRFNLLLPGVHRYLRYMVKDGRRSAVDIWTRTITFEERDGRRLMHIVQRWDETADQKTPFFLIQDSWFESGTFRPLTHIRHRERDGKVEVSGYRFLPDKIVGIADLPNNLKKDFSVAAQEPSYNFEYDMELLQVLPLHAGYTANIPFYDAGFDPPARYNFVVAGSGTIAGPDGRPVDCWVLTADYNTGKVSSRFWLDKRTQVLIREEQPQDDGALLVKTLLNPESADAVTGASNRP